ncbi:TonB-dependent receptor [Sphingobacterium sp. Lzh-3]|uniref:SusC/RagA family TonB-linked outer membrane protein n=1 Tax=unclassified Sphingobacterium TaxID=2609468 RepID=UPI002953C205|nr:TonB-dependent receptor [Sphingobacterium sp. UGAL515B_05]WON96737.1 TonB-dependent receptor [Sphingobacterium sp. UGAL515B_05]
MRKTALLLLLSTYGSLAFAQQSQKVRGKVLDADNKPVAGATVNIKGSASGTKTDADGSFTLDVAKGKTLKITYVGMKEQEVLVNDASTYSIVLQSGTELDEVVVIGYGTVKKSDLTGAVASVTGKDLQSNLAKSAAGALQGRVAGVTVSNAGGTPGAGMSINIRGISSLGNNTPLYVIDGVFGDINLVDPNDIASLEVLKDASAAAIYGSRAANGVVLITTKGGHRASPATVGINAYTGVQSIPKKLKVMDGPQWKQFMTDQKELPVQAESFNANTNWQDEIYHVAPVNKINLDIAGGGERSTYNVSAGYLDQEGILKTTGYKAFNIRSKNTFSFFNEHLRVGNTFLVKSGDRKFSHLVITDALRQNPLLPIYDSNIVGGYSTYAPWMKNLDNPVGNLNLNNNHVYQTDIMLNGYAEVDLFVKGLKYRLNVGVNRTSGRNYAKADRRPDGTAILQSSLNESAFFNNQWLIENTLHYDNTFDKHTISLLAGYSAQENTNRGFGASRLNIPFGTDAINAGGLDGQTTSGSLQEEALISQFGRAMYSYDSRYMLTATVRRDGSSKFADGYRYGVFPSVALGWNVMNEHFFEKAKNTINELKVRATYGRLGNQNIANYTTQSLTSYGFNYIQGGALWLGSSTGIGWTSPVNLTWEETETSNVGLDLAFLQNKLSISTDYYVRDTKGILLGINRPSSAGLQGSPIMNAGTIRNKGFEFLATYRDKVGEVNYNIGVNASTVKNEMKAVTIGTVQEFGGFNPNNDGTITWAKVGYPIGGFWLIQTDGLFQSDAEVQAYKSADGKVIQSTAKAGDIKFVDYNGDGQINNDDRQYAGSPYPKLAYGIRGGLDYKGFDFAFFFDGMYGNKVYNYTRARMEGTSDINNYSIDLLNSWTPSNTNTDIPRYTRQDLNDNKRRVSDRWLESGAFFRLKTIEFGYTLPSEWLSKASLKNARVFVAGENLFTVTKYKGYTPDVGMNSDENGGGSGPMTAGTDYGRFPLARTIMFGIQANF